MYCGVCNKTKHDTDENFKDIDDNIKVVLAVLSLKLITRLTLNGIDPPKICSDCSEKLFAAFDFKSTCLYTENKIVPYISFEVSKVDLREVYLKELRNKRIFKLEDDLKICRLCMELISGEFILISEVENGLMDKFIPEMDMTFSEDPVVCQPCFQSLNVHGSFVRGYVANTLNREELANSSCDDTATQSDPSSFSLLAKMEDIEFGSHISEEEDKPEFVELTVEGSENEEKMDIETPQINMKMEENVSKEPLNSSSTPAVINLEDDQGDTSLEMLQKQYKYKCEKCNYKTRYAHNFISHQLTHKSSPKVHAYKCDDCGYEAKNKHYLEKHRTVHKDPPDAIVNISDTDISSTSSKDQIIKANTVDLGETGQSKTNMQKNMDVEKQMENTGDSLKSGQLNDKTTANVQMYECDLCDFKTKYEYILTTHQVLHKNTSELTMYKCDKCSFESTYKNLQCHRLTHLEDPSARPSKIKMHKCDKCDYETRRKGDLKIHELKHKNSSDSRIYKCDKCAFKSMYESNLKLHQVVHNDLLRCDRCDFQPKDREDLIVHQLKHIGP